MLIHPTLSDKLFFTPVKTTGDYLGISVRQEEIGPALILGGSGSVCKELNLYPHLLGIVFTSNALMEKRVCEKKREN